MRPARVELALLAAVPLLWGSAFVAIRAGLLAGASPFVFAEYRYVLATLVVTGAALASRQPRPERRAFVPAAVLGGIFLMGGYAGFLYWAEQFTSGGLASVLVSTVPLWTVLFAFPLLPGERLRIVGWGGIVLGLAGVVVLFLPGLTTVHSREFPGLLAGVAAAASAAAGSVLLRRSGVRPSNLWNLSGEFGVASLVLLPLALLTPGGLAFPVTPVTVGTLLYLALGSSVLGYGLYFHLLQRTGPSHANVVAYLNPVVGLTVGLLLLGESVTAVELSGFGLIVLSVAVLQWERQRPRPGGTRRDPAQAP